MPVKWKLFRIVCILQMLSSSVFTITALIHLMQAGGFTAFIRMILFLFIFLLTILAIDILHNNYPDAPVTGKQKSRFNRLFLLNFLFLVFLFGIIFAEFRQLNNLSEFISKPVFALPAELFIPIITSIVTLVFQFILLYGLYQLRRELYTNFLKKEFEFERQQAM